MGFFSTLKEKLTGKKAEQSTVLPTLQDIDKENKALTGMETQTVESIINAPPAPPSAETGNTTPSMGPMPDGMPTSISGETIAVPAVPPSPLKTVKKAVKRKAVAKKTTKKAAPKRKAVKKVAVKKAAPKKKTAAKKTVKKATPKKKAAKKTVVKKAAPKKKSGKKKR